MENFKTRTFVNGVALQRSIGKTVSILVKPINIDSSSRILTMSTTDGMEVKVVVEDPLNAPIEDWVEVHGIVESGESIKCSEVSFTPIIFLRNCSFL